LCIKSKHFKYQTPRKKDDVHWRKAEKLHDRRNPHDDLTLLSSSSTNSFSFIDGLFILLICLQCILYGLLLVPESSQQSLTCNAGEKENLIDRRDSVSIHAITTERGLSFLRS
jgi:hypothetical protein